MSDCVRFEHLRDARDAFKAAVQCNPNYVAAYHGWGTVSLEMGDSAEAIKQLSQATRLDPNHLGSWNNLLIAAKVAGRRREARRAYRRILHNKRTDAEALYMRSLAAYNKGDALYAIRLFRKAYRDSGQWNPAFAPLREHLEAERIALLRTPTFSEYWSEHLSLRGAQFKAQLLGQGRRHLPHLIVGASVAAGISLAVYLPTQLHFSFDENVEYTGQPTVQLDESAVYDESSRSEHFAPQPREVVETVEPSPQVPTPIVQATPLVKPKATSLESERKADPAVAPVALEIKPEESFVIGEAQPQRAPEGVEVAQTSTPAEGMRAQVGNTSKEVASATAEDTAPDYSMLSQLCAVREEAIMVHAAQPDYFAESDEDELAEPVQDAQSSADEKPTAPLTSYSPIWVPSPFSPLFVPSTYYGVPSRDEIEQDYNIKLGPVLLSLSASSKFTYSDNVALSPDKRSDMILNSAFSTKAVYPMSDFNTISLNFVMGYNHYFSNDDLSSTIFTIDPLSDSGIEFEMVFDRLTLLFYDKLVITEDPFMEPSISGLAQWRMFTNTFGMNALWDYSDTQLNFGISQGITKMIGGSRQFDYLDRWTNQMNGSAKFQVQPWFNLGVGGNYTHSIYNKNKRSDTKIMSLGPTFNMEVSQTIDLSGALMYTRNLVSGGRTGGSRKNASGSLSIAHELNELMTQALSYSYSVSPAIEANSDFMKTTNVNYQFNWEMSGQSSFKAKVGYSRGKEDSTSTFRRTDFMFNYVHSFPPHITWDLGVGHAFKTSDDSLSNYKRNILESSVSYKF